jgi:hypothetical protein
MTHVPDETKLSKFFRFLHGVSERALKGSLDIEQFTSVAQTLLDKGARAANLLEYVAKGCPKVDYTQPVPKAKNARRQKQSTAIIDLDADPFVPDGWKVEEHTKSGPFAFDSSQVKLHIDAGQQNGKRIGGNDLRKKLKNVPVMNANLLDWYLANPRHIPEEWKGKYVFFWGTIYRHRRGDLVVRCLYWDGGQWCWGHCWLGYGWSADNPAAVLASTQS